MERELDVYDLKEKELNNINLNEKERKINDIVIPVEIFEKEAYRVLLRKIRLQDKEIKELKKLLDDNKIEYKKDLKK